MAIASFILAMVALPWIAICVPIIVLLMVLIQRFYVRTSKQLRLLEYVHSNNRLNYH